jgi:stringent starvation protein B
VRWVVLLALVACEKSEPPCKCEQPRRIDAAEAPSRAKHRTLDRMLAQGPVLIRLDARKPGVVVPQEHASDPQLRLRLGKELDPPVTDLVVDDRGVTGSLTFHGTPFHCVLPWSAIYGLQLELPTAEELWNDEIPKDLGSAAASPRPGE